MKEIPYNWQSSIALGWAFAWRAALVSIPFGFGVQFIPDTSPGLLAIKSVAEILAMVVSCFIAAHWLRARGFGSVRVMLVEWAEYQKANEENQSNGA